MKTRILLAELKNSILSVLILGILFCGVYPLTIWGFARLFFVHQAEGSIVERQGQVVGSTLIGQAFHSDRYFHSRPSAAGAGYDAVRSGGSNLGPLSRVLVEQVRKRVQAYRASNNLPNEMNVPADAVLAPGSGLDPHISPENASIQASRVARARGISIEEVQNLIDRHIERPQLGFLGEYRVNVLKLNLALDAL